MAIEILMPALSPTMEEGTLAKWLVGVGDTVRPGDIIAEIETDKATMEVESADDGVVETLLVAEGTSGVKVNTPIARLAVNELSEPETVVEKLPPSVAPHPTPVSEPPARAPRQRSKVRNKTVTHEDVVPEWPASAELAHITMRQALRDCMAEEMRCDDDVFLMGEEVAHYQGAYKISQGLLEEFGERRVIDTPITEHGFAGIGVGAAMAGLKPIVEFMTWNFAMQAIDHIVNSAAKTRYMSGGQMSVPMVFRGPNGAASRVGAQHSQCYSSWYAHVPGLKVVAPSTPSDAKGLLRSAIRDPNPVVVLENEILYGASGDVPVDSNWSVPIGKARVVRSGGDVTIVSFARGMSYAREAGDVLATEGVAAEIIDLRSLRPLDLETVARSVRKTNRIVVVEEAWPVCSVGSEICAQMAMMAFDDLDAPPVKVSGADVPMPYAANLERLALPSVEAVVAAARSTLYI